MTEANNDSTNHNENRIDHQQIAESEALLGGLCIGAVAGVVHPFLAAIMVASGLGITLWVRYRNRFLQPN